MSKKIISYFLSFLLFISFSVTIFLAIFSNTILDSNFVIKVLDENDYYDMVDELIKDGFRDYIYQSGFDETILEDLYTRQELKKDVKLMISNLFFEQNEVIDTEKIKDRIRNNIDKYLEDNNLVLAEEQEGSVDKYIDLLAKNYEDKITLSAFLNQINDTTNKIKNMIEKYESYIYIMPILIAVLILLINIKKLHKVFLYTGIAGISSGITNIIISLFVESKITVNNIFIFNDAISIVIRNLINIYMKNIFVIGGLLIGVSTIFLLLHNFVKEKYYTKSI